MKRHASLAALVIAGLFLTVGLARGVMADDWSKDDKKKDEKAAAGAKPGDAAAKSGGASEDKAFDDVVKDMEVVHGLFTFYRKADENKTLMEIAPAQMESLFLFATSIDQSVGERGFYGAQQGPDFPMFFHRVGKTVQWVLKNASFSAPDGSPAARTAARSFANGILGSTKILSKPHPERKSVLIDANDLFATRDFPGFAAALSRAYQPTNFSFDKERSAVTGVKDFPENAIVEVNLHYQTDNARSVSVTLADARSVPISVRYALSTLKQTDYKPRLADDRIGHFLAIQQDISTDEPQSPYVRRITRWNLQKSDPNAALSPPKQPIVYWLENTIPLEYRDPIREGVLLWNKAFEKVGIKDAIVVKQQPDTASWDPADTRYNTIRWFAGVDATFAIGPSRANPFTGEIYDADVSISEGIVRYARRFGEEFVGPSESSEQQPLWMWSNWSRDPRNMCDYADGFAQQGALGLAVLEARGELTPEVEKKFMSQYITELTAHEVGHTLGLRHNFRGSSILSPRDLNDVAKTHELGQSASVMDYNPVILAAKGQTQGDFVTTTLGPYDYWAIEYAYKPIQGDETAALAEIAARGSNDPMLPYSTDEDALGTYSPASIDPLANQYDASNAPIEYFRQRLDIVHELWGSMETNLAHNGDGYQILRRGMGRGLAESYRSLMTTSKLIGGINHRRDHVGDPGGHSPYTPVPAVQQREALDFLSKCAFSDAAFKIPASLQNKLAIERIPGLDPAYYSAQRLDYPWHDAVLSVQRSVLTRLLHPITLGRVLDNELRFGPGEKAFRMVDLFNGLNGSIWSELDNGSGEISSVRRNLQREYLNQLIRITLRTPDAAGASVAGAAAPPTPPMPEDATTLARASLVRVQTKIRARLIAKAPIEATTRAHLQETQARITAALDAQMQKPVN
jgi:hypothetical protein